MRRSELKKIAAEVVDEAVALTNERLQRGIREPLPNETLAHLFGVVAERHRLTEGDMKKVFERLPAALKKLDRQVDRNLKLLDVFVGRVHAQNLDPA